MLVIFSIIEAEYNSGDKHPDDGSQFKETEKNEQYFCD
jgi:hypothetical protein